MKLGCPFVTLRTNLRLLFQFSTGNDFKKVELFKVELNSYLLNFIKNLKTLVKIECS